MLPYFKLNTEEATESIMEADANIFWELKCLIHRYKELQSSLDPNKAEKYCIAQSLRNGELLLLFFGGGIILILK